MGIKILVGKFTKESEMDIKIIKEQDDPICTRISAGGNFEIGYYLVYRGDFEEVKKIMEILLIELTKEKNNG